MDMCSGPLFSKIVRYTLPIIFSGILQLLYNAADLVIVGKYAGKTSLAAVGSTGSLTNLIVNLFIGLSVGTGVVVAQSIGAADRGKIYRTVQTSVTVSVIVGVAVGIFGMLASEQLLRLMDTPDDVLGLSSLYMRIYFAGMPANMLYNFGAAILRADGDTKRPLYFLTAAGLVNIVLNYITVRYMNMDVAGVASATVISQVISAVLVLRALIKGSKNCRFDIRRPAVYRGELTAVARVGLPAGLQGVLFAFSNVLIQSSVNSFGSVAMAGNAASGNIEGFVYTSMNAVYQTATTFCSQNYGAGNYRRINKILIECLASVTVIGTVMGYAAYFMGGRLLSLYNSDPEVIEYGLIRMSVIITTYALCGIMDVLVGALRGEGYFTMPMVVSIGVICGMRIVWLYTAFRAFHTLRCLYISYPISWLLAVICHLICWFAVKPRVRKRLEARAICSEAESDT